MSDVVVLLCSTVLFAATMTTEAGRPAALLWFVVAIAVLVRAFRDRPYDSSQRTLAVVAWGSTLHWLVFLASRRSTLGSGEPGGPSDWFDVLGFPWHGVERHRREYASDAPIIGSFRQSTLFYLDTGYVCFLTNWLLWCLLVYVVLLRVSEERSVKLPRFGMLLLVPATWAGLAYLHAAPPDYQPR